MRQNGELVSRAGSGSAGRGFGRRWAVALGATLMLAPMLTACSDGGDTAPLALSCPAQAGGPVTLAVGARANNPAPVLDPAILQLMREAARKSQPISVVRVDGAPSVAFQGTFESTAANEVARDSELEDFVTTVQQHVAALLPKSPEADVLAAIGEAARITPAGGTVVLMDSGLQTTGQIRYQDDGTFGAEPSEFVDYLDARSLMPSLNGISVVLVGLGNTAEPQAQLDPSLRSRVTSLWETVAREAGATCVQVVDTAGSRTSVSTDVPVSAVALPTIEPFKACGDIVLRDDTVGFIGDQANFRDPQAARKTLQEIADLLIGGRQEVELIGTTAKAGNNEAGRKRLAQARAEAVKAVLVEFGVEEARITAIGVGTEWPDRVPDVAPDGSLIPWAAALNRSVIVRLSCPTSPVEG